MNCMPCRPLQASIVLAALASAAVAGRWIVPDWPEGQPPKFEAVPLFWFTVTDCPLVYRAEVEVPPEADRATVLLRTSGYVYVYVDGRPAHSWAPRPKDKDHPEIPADPARVHELDLSEYLTPGRHALCVSAPAKGFALDGAVYAGTKPVQAIETSRAWRVRAFAPTTIVEAEAFLLPGYDGPSAPVREEAGGPGSGADGTAELRAGEDLLAKAHHAAFVRRARRDLDDALWRLGLMVKKGIYLAGGEALGWGGPLRMDAAALKRASVAYGAALDIARNLAELEKPTVNSVADLAGALPALRAVRRALDAARAEAEQASREAFAADERKALALAAAAVGDGLSLDDALASPARLREQVDAQVRHPLNHLNQSRYDRLGWIEHAGLTDSDILQWGIRVNPVSGPTKAGPAGEWARFLFSPDPDDEGVRDLRWSIGHNVENQWQRIDPRVSWTKDARFADHKGPAWYRTRIHAPAEWAGNEVVLTFAVAGRERVWLNDKEITEFGTGAGNRTYTLPADLLAFGAENFLAFRIDADGDQRGLVGPVELACPALDAPAARETPPTDVLATPLSPCVVLTPWTDTLRIHHAGEATLLLPGQLKFGRCDYRADRDGRLSANWALLWLAPHTAVSPVRPILLVFRRCPAKIDGVPGQTTIKMSRPRERIIAVRPWVKAKLDDPRFLLRLDDAIGLWRRAALAVPLDYMSVTRLLAPGEPWEKISADKVPRGPLLGHTVIYDFLETKDEWDTKPLRLAPLPALCSFARDCGFRNLKLDRRVVDIQDGGLLAPYRVVMDADRVSYSYDVEPYPRFAGFTSWMFADGDAGVPGNRRELELLAALGANSFRPQHNWSDEKPPKPLHPGDERTRVQVTADCANAVGMNYMNNIDQTLGRPREFVRDNYAEFMGLVGAHYEKIARQLAGRPFWAVAYDLINEPFDHHHARYNPAIKELTRKVRAIDNVHLLYIEPCEAWGAIQQLKLIEPTGDPLTVYSFHDYNFRLNKPEDRWPNAERDLTSIYAMWLPAIEFQIRHGCALHCGEFGGFADSTADSLAQTLLLNDFFRIFDQFGMHHHYYSGREVYRRQADGSLRPSNIARAYQAYFRRPDFNRHYPLWPGHPKPSQPGR